MVEDYEFSVVGSDTDADAYGFEFPGFADEFVFEGAGEDEKRSVFQVEFGHDAIEEKLAGLPTHMAYIPK